MKSLNRRVSLALRDRGYAGGGGRSVSLLFSILTTNFKWILLTGTASQYLEFKIQQEL